jgi:glycosyltransferase involved in cell wall biosynthesis
MTDGLISVVIPVYNAVAYLGEAIDSVLAQSYRPLELIVVDDGSDDGSGQVAQSYGERLTYVSQARGGNGAARNAGLAVARGDFLAFLDADDRFVPGKLGRQAAAFASDPSLDIVFGHVREFVSPELDDEAKRLLRAPVSEAPWAAPNLMLVRRSSFDRVGPFSEQLRVGVTVDWYARATELALRTEMIPAIVLERRLHASNNGMREHDARWQYLRVLRASMERRRNAEIHGPIH